MKTSSQRRPIGRSHLRGDGVLLLWSVQLDGGDVALRGDQQRLVRRSAPGSHLGRGPAFCLHQGANQVAVLLPGFFLFGLKVRST